MGSWFHNSSFSRLPNKLRIRLNTKRSVELVGKTGVTTTTLRPTGEALVDGSKYAVIAEGGGYIDAGTIVEISAYRNGMLCVLGFCETRVNM